MLELTGWACAGVYALCVVAGLVWTLLIIARGVAERRDRNEKRY